ncbi:MAG: aa3-type cytochrome c oxidase subunit IV [Alphaproteobacteria bacterium]
MVDLNQLDEGHRHTWHSTVKVARNSIIGIALLLILMAIFLL